MDFPYRTGHPFPLYLAPMSGVSESPFRLLCRRFGADVVVSEFISAVGVARGLEHLFEDMRFEPDERPIGIQLYGADATIMAHIFEQDRKSTRLNSSHLVISYAVFCLKKKKPPRFATASERYCTRASARP